MHTVNGFQVPDFSDKNATPDDLSNLASQQLVSPNKILPAANGGTGTSTGNTVNSDNAGKFLTPRTFRMDLLNGGAVSFFGNANCTFNRSNTYILPRDLGGSGNTTGQFFSVSEETKVMTLQSNYNTLFYFDCPLHVGNVIDYVCTQNTTTDNTIVVNVGTTNREGNANFLRVIVYVLNLGNTEVDVSFTCKFWFDRA